MAMHVSLISKTWLFARSEGGKDLKNMYKKAWKIVLHNKF
jgi:hypothetical protein